MASEKVVNLDRENFQREIQGETPILVDFWAAWCGPCRMVAPLLDELAEEMDGRVRIGKVDIDQNQDLAVQFQVSSIPTFLVFKNGQVKERMMGARPKAAFEQLLERHA